MLSGLFVSVPGKRSSPVAEGAAVETDSLDVPAKIDPQKGVVQ